MAVLGPRCWAQAFSSCGERGLLIAVASRCGARALGRAGFSSCGTRAQ